MSRDEVIKYTADVVLFNGQGSVLLIKRRWAPFEGMWALPGGHVDKGETAEEAALRELAEETGVVVRGDELSLLCLLDDPERDPRGRYVSVVFVAWVDHRVQVVAEDDAAELAWRSVDDLPDMAFDHGKLLTQMAEMAHAARAASYAAQDGAL